RGGLGEIGRIDVALGRDAVPAPPPISRARRNSGHGGSAGKMTSGGRQGDRSALEVRVDQLLEVLKGGAALQLRAVDEEGRCRIHLELLIRLILALLDGVEHALIGET